MKIDPTTMPEIKMPDQFGLENNDFPDSPVKTLRKKIIEVIRDFPEPLTIEQTIGALIVIQRRLEYLARAKNIQEIISRGI